ncbi:GntP family permease [Syntrophomonas curvata]
MDWLASLGILIGIALLIYLAFKGVSILIIGPITAVLIILTNGMDLIPALFSDSNSYMVGLGNFITKYFIIFILGAILGKYLEDSKATVTIANSVLKLTGRSNPYAVLIAVFIIGALLTFGGVNIFIVIFTIVALSRPLFRELNIPWHLLLAPMVLGCATFTMTMFPGSPSIQNVIPTVLGTTLTAAPLIGIVASITVTVWGLLYMKWQLKIALDNGEEYVRTAADGNAGASTGEIPSLGAALAPMVVLIAIILIGSAMKISDVIIPALLAAIIVAAIVLNKFIPHQLGTLNAGAANAMSPAIFTAAAVGVGIVAASAPGFKVILGLIGSLPGGALVEMSAITGFLAAVTGSSSGALGIVMPAFSGAWLATGIAPEVIHRISAIASGGLSCMPHSGVVFALMAITGLTHKQCYKHIFWVGLVGSTIALIVSIIMAVLMY